MKPLRSRHHNSRRGLAVATVSSICLAVTILAACGGGDDAAAPSAPAQVPATPNNPNVPVTPQLPATYTVGGMLAGLASSATVILQNNGVDALSLSASGAFTFPTSVTDVYAVTVGTQPSGQTCTVTNGAGTASANVTDVTVNCVNNPPPQPQVSTFAGDGTPGSADGTLATARFLSAAGMSFDAAGNLYLADLDNQAIRKITPGGVVSTIAGNTHAMGAADGAAATATFKYPSGVIADSVGNVYVVDQSNHRIRQIDNTNTVSTLAGSTAGYLDGTGTGAQFNSPYAGVVDAVGNLYVTEFSNNRIRKITPGGVVTTFAGSTGGYLDGTGTGAQFQSPSGIAIDASGNLYVADTSNNKIRKITPAGVVTTIAGSTYGFADGTGTAAQFAAPFGLALDADGNLYVADRGNNRIRKITPAGVVTTIAGDGTAGNTNGDGNVARFSNPTYLAIDAAKNLYVTELNGLVIRKIVLQ
ncbi:NHL repeat-containing protein [Cupriavidus pampae]|uniref:Virginiamycin B lyase n=1 Tax=Cupriavidus pampae TaxID=659251 RepID=A0ABN7ZCD0_9BURK|nr:NHL repeat-containing protein [Cupriavidus pampae]CAG9183259.1 Virginiamycin B lyase [Cupriavidus pampae]